MKKIIITILFLSSLLMPNPVLAVMKKGVNIPTETNIADVSVPPEITDQDIGYLKDLGVDFVLISPGWYRLACRNPNLDSVKINNNKTIYVSSEYNTDSRKENAFDGNPNTVWSSIQQQSPAIQEWLSVKLDTSETINKIVLTPRVNGGRIQSFPSDFSLAYSDDGTNWTKYPNLIFTNYLSPSLQPDSTAPQIIFSIPSPTPHQYYAFGATKATPDTNGLYYVQLADISLMKVQPLYNSDNPNNPAYNWGFLDRSIDRLIAAGILPIIQPTGTPRWLTEDNIDSCWSEPLYPNLISYFAMVPNKYDGLLEFGHFMKAMAQRYKGKVSIYSLWNEPNHGTYWKGSVDQYVTMVNFTYDQIKSVDSSIEVWAGNTAPDAYAGGIKPLPFFNQAKALGIKFDVWGHHFYPADNTQAPWLQTPTSGIITLNNASDLISAVGDKPMANSESGYYTRCRVNCTAFTSETNQADYLQWSMNQFNQYPQVHYWTNFMLYNHFNWGTGFIRVDQNNRQLPVYQVFKNFNLTTTPLPGDLDGDGHVNIYDYNLLVSKFGNPYTIFDYNDLVTNFGR